MFYDGSKNQFRLFFSSRGLLAKINAFFLPKLAAHFLSRQTGKGDAARNSKFGLIVSLIDGTRHKTWERDGVVENRE